MIPKRMEWCYMQKRLVLTSQILILFPEYMLIETIYYFMEIYEHIFHFIEPCICQKVETGAAMFIFFVFDNKLKCC